MNPQRWQIIKATLDTARGHQAEARSAYLDSVRSSDPELAGEVEDLLAHDRADGFLEKPAAPRDALAAGTRLGSFVIRELVGAGGMGAVYRATDTRLDRTVAIKLLPAELAADPERRERFQREAKAIAGLTHPHICTLHDVGHETPSGSWAHPVDFLVLELLEGETLEHRLARGPLPVEQALQVGMQVADALDKAHLQGITHRDLKPGNIFLTKTGASDQGTPQAKVLDFGLAKLTGADVERPRPTEEGSQAPVGSLTAAGAILGTLHYMSPERLDGGQSDHRSDIWALGCVLYEMVTGQPAFDGETQGEVTKAIGAVELAPPSMLSTRELTAPVGLEHVVRTCLQKEPTDRWHSAGDIARQLSGLVAQVASQQREAKQAAADRLTVWRPVATTAVVALVLLAVGGLITWNVIRSTVALPGQVTRMSIVFPEAHVRMVNESRGFAVSPSGSHVVYEANRELYLRALDRFDAQLVPGTEGTDPTSPFFSPDGQWIGFYSYRDDALQKIPVSGGTPVTLFEGQSAMSPNWGPDDQIIFGREGAGIL